MNCSKTVCFAIILMLGAFQFGFVLNYGGVPIEKLKEAYPNWDYEKDRKKTSYFINFASLFGSIGGFTIQFLVHFTTGRKALFIFCILNFICWLLYLILTPKMLLLGIILRCIQGVITGGTACLTPVMMTNIAPDDAVGMFGCMNQLGIVFGMVLFSFIAAFANYKIMAIIAAVFNAIYCGLIWIIPEQKADKAAKETVFQRKYALNIFVGIFLMIFQQFCGMNAIMAHMSSIMAETGLNIEDNLQSAFSTSTQLISVFVAMFNMDGVGRRKMWVFSTCGIIISQIMYILSLTVTTVGWLRASSVFILMLSFGQGYGPIPWFICHDLFPKSVRLSGQALITFGNMLSSFGVVYLFPIMNDKLKEYITIIIFMCITIVAIPFGWFLIPKKSAKNEENLTLI